MKYKTMQTLAYGKCLHRTSTFRSSLSQLKSKVKICGSDSVTRFQVLFSPNGRETIHFWSRNFTQGKFSRAAESPKPSPFHSAFEWYSKKLDTDPILTKCFSAGLISTIGNVLAQGITYRQNCREKESDTENKLEIHHEPFVVDLAQVTRFAFLNVTFVAPVLHHWYQFINRSVPGRSLSKVLQRTFWDEFVFSPVYVSAFLGILWKLEGSTNDDILKMIKSECPSVIVAEWVIWVPTMIVTFRHVPVKFQVLVINVVGVAWQTFLAYSANNAHSVSSNQVEDVDEIEGKEIYPSKSKR